MALTKKQLENIIRECDMQPMGDLHGSPTMGRIKIIKLGAVPPQEEISAGLFPGMHHSHKGSDDMHGDLFPSITHHNDDHDPDHGEKSMIKSNLARIADKASELSRLAGEMPDNEEWVQEKIAVAASMIDAVHGYLKYTDEK
jgi:hypothetical protein